METATARMIEKNVFMVLKVSLPPARVRLPFFTAMYVDTIVAVPSLGDQKSRYRRITSTGDCDQFAKALGLNRPAAMPQPGGAQSWPLL
jgi:hypothetical protein